MLCGYAESDFDPDVQQTPRVGGIYQQDTRYWGTPEQVRDIDYATQSILRGRDNGNPNFSSIPLTSKPVEDCWRVQQWLITPLVKPEQDLVKFYAMRETLNYSRRLGDVVELINNPRFFADHEGG